MTADSNSNPWTSPAEVTVTMKAGGGYAAPWIVFKGSTASVYDSITETFGWRPEVGKFTLAEVVSAVASEFQGIWSAVDVLEGKLIDANGQSATAGMNPGEKPASSVYRTAEQQENALTGPDKNVFDMIRHADDKTQMENIWKRYYVTIQNNPVVMSAYKEHARVIKSNKKK
jgi:hypothetical protein